MEKQEKAFILNKGLILGLVLMLFPIIDLLYGLDNVIKEIDTLIVNNNDTINRPTKI